MTLTNPHDKFFKDIFLRHQAARDFLQYYLPAEVSALFDLDTLDISKDSFIDPDLQEHFSDVLYQVDLLTKQSTYIYVLFEHKSYTDKQIAFQLLRYMVRIWEQQLKQAQPLRPILPLVIYHGPNKWSVNLQFIGLFGDNFPSELKPYMPDFNYWLLDLSGYPDEKLKGWVILQVGLRLLKYIWADNLTERLAEILALLLELHDNETALEYLYTILRYVSSASDKVTDEALKTVVLDLFKEEETVMSTLAEKWIQEGIQKGIEIGREKGIQKGIEEGIEIGREKGIEIGQERGAQQEALNLLLRTLPRLFGELQPGLTEQVNRLSLPQLRRAMDMAFDVGSLDEFAAQITVWLAPSEAES